MGITQIDNRMQSKLRHYGNDITKVIMMITSQNQDYMVMLSQNIFQIFLKKKLLSKLRELAKPENQNFLMFLFTFFLC